MSPILLLCLILLVLVIGIICGLIVYARWHYGTLEKSGVPVIKPTFFMGSVPDLHKKVQTDEDILRYNKYGLNWALYEGRTPAIYICDPKLLKLIFVKDMDHFYDRRIKHFQDPRIDEILDYLPGEKWRRMRKLQTVLFSSGKLREYNSRLADAAYAYVDNLQSRCVDGRVKINTRESLDVLSLDGIARACFRIKLENSEDPNNHFFQSLKLLLGHGQEFTWLYSLTMVFPFLTKLAPAFQISDVLFDTFRQIVFARRQEKLQKAAENLTLDNKITDLSDLLLECYDQLNSPDFKRLGIDEMTILAQALNLTSIDMDSATQTMMSYFLAMNPKVQDKLYEEIVEVIDGKYGGRIDHETIGDLPYLTACINEALRLGAPLIRPERVCTKDWKSPDGKIRIKEGTTVMTPLWAVHRNPDYFPNPERYEPERFLRAVEDPEIQAYMPYAFAPFGLGPRNCIGMRLALEALKVNIIIILKKFRYVVRDDTKLGFRPGSLYLLYFHPLFLDMELRR